MEESSEMHSEEENLVPEKNKKRRLKTPTQVVALENFYNEHKYPTEAMKLEVAEKIGLTEKQVSGWFCHRRLKDKRLLEEGCANGRLDRSSGVIQDHGSGFGQDSCGSTKPGEFRHVDPKEVDSRMLYGQEIQAADLNYEKRSNYTGNISSTDDTSSESSSAIQDKFISHGQDSMGLESSRYQRQSGGIIPRNGNGVKNRPSGYLKLKGSIEHAAITAVKRQLGRHYRQDGPQLSIEFDPLPPGAFETPTRELDHEPYHAINPIQPHSQPRDTSGGRKQRVLSTTNDVYNATICSQDSYMEQDNIRALHGPNSQDYSHHQLKHKSSFPNYSHPLSVRNSSLDINDVSAGKTSVYNPNRSLAMRSKHGVDEMILESISNPHLHVYDEKITKEQKEPYMLNYEDVKPKTVQRKEFLRTKPSHSLLRHNESLEKEGEGSSRRMSKDRKPYGGKNASKEYPTPVRVKMNSTNEMMVLPKRVKNEPPTQDYVAKALCSDTPPWTNQIKRSVAEMPSSFSEDETADTSTSLD